MNDIPPDDLEIDDEDFRTIWQRPAVKIPLAIVGLAGLAFFLFQIGIIGWVGDRINDVIGEARYAQRSFTEDVLEHTEMGELHAEVLPAYNYGVIQSANPDRDPRLVDLMAQMKDLADDDELNQLIDDMHRELTRETYDLEPIELAWNKRLAELDEPYALVGATVEEHHEILYMPETYRIVGEIEVDVDGRDHVVEWRHRIDNFRRAAEPTFYDEPLDQAWVRSDRGWITVWNQIIPSILTDEDVEEVGETVQRRSFTWRPELREEVRTILGDEHFEAVIRGAVRRQHLESIAIDVANRGRDCGQNFVITRVPWFGFESDSLDRFREMAKTDRFDSCPRVTQDEASRIRRISRDMQSDFKYQEAMPRLLAAFLTQKTYMSAAHRHRATSEEPPCAECEGWTDSDAAELGGYLSGTVHGPYPLLGLSRLCFDHRYGSPASYRGWLTLLSDEGFSCTEELPDTLIASLRAIERDRFSRIDSIELVTEPPEKAPIYRKD